MAALRPGWVVPGGHLTIEGSRLPLLPDAPPRVIVGDTPAQVLGASPHCIRALLSPETPSGTAAVRLEPGSVEAGTIEVARQVANGLHQVDNPVFDADGRLYLTHSGARGVTVPVPIYRLDRDGAREPVAIDLPNPTGFALGPDGRLYVSSRFEGQVLRMTDDDATELYAAELGTPTGLAFDADGALYVGDRSGSIFRVSASREVETFATLPSSVAAFHLAFGPDACLYVSGPTLASHDVVYRITPDRLVETFLDGFGRPQGLAFDGRGDLYVVDALAGAAGLYRVGVDAAERVPELVLTAPALIGVAFDPNGGLVVASGDTAWRVPVPVLPLPLPFARAG